MAYIEVYPAYGRDYTRQADVKADWKAGLDFRTYAGPYINKQDADNEPGLRVLVRYADQRKVVQVK